MGNNVRRMDAIIALQVALGRTVVLSSHNAIQTAICIIGIAAATGTLVLQPKIAGLLAIAATAAAPAAAPQMPGKSARTARPYRYMILVIIQLGLPHVLLVA